jgi:hypothetical protein
MFLTSPARATCSVNMAVLELVRRLIGRVEIKMEVTADVCQGSGAVIGSHVARARTVPSAGSVAVAR